MSDVAAPCASCGLCCDGTLFARAKTSPDEAGRVRSFGLDVHADEAGFSLPCHLLDGTACTIYAERFTVCRSFRCMVLRGLDSGAHDRSRADALIAEARRLRTVAERHVAGAGQAAARREHLLRLSDWATRTEAADRRAAAEAYLALGALERFAATHFRRPPKSPLADAPASAEGGAKGAA